MGLRAIETYVNVSNFLVKIEIFQVLLIPYKGLLQMQCNWANES